MIYFGVINDLYKEGFNKSKASKQKIKNICGDSIFILSNKEKDYFEGKYEKEIENEKENKKEKKLEIITLKDIQELKKRIQITRNISID